MLGAGPGPDSRYDKTARQVAEELGFDIRAVQLWTTAARACPHRKIKRGRHTLWFNSDLTKEWRAAQGLEPDRRALFNAPAGAAGVGAPAPTSSPPSAAPAPAADPALAERADIGESEDLLVSAEREVRRMVEAFRGGNSASTLSLSQLMDALKKLEDAKRRQEEVRIKGEERARLRMQRADSQTLLETMGGVFLNVLDRFTLAVPPLARQAAVEHLAAGGVRGAAAMLGEVFERTLVGALRVLVETERARLVGQIDAAAARMEAGAGDGPAETREAA